MPTYEYLCRSCDAHLEVVQRFDDAALTECPTCGGALRKVFGNIGISFKGSGFYKNDSRSLGKSNNGAAKSGDGAKDAGGGEGKDAASTTTSDGSASTGKDAAPAAKESKGSKDASSSSTPAKSA